MIVILWILFRWSEYHVQFCLCIFVARRFVVFQKYSILSSWILMSLYEGNNVRYDYTHTYVNACTFCFIYCIFLCGVQVSVQSWIFRRIDLLKGHYKRTKCHQTPWFYSITEPVTLCIIIIMLLQVPYWYRVCSDAEHELCCHMKFMLSCISDGGRDRKKSVEIISEFAASMC